MIKKHKKERNTRGRKVNKEKNNNKRQSDYKRPWEMKTSLEAMNSVSKLTTNRRLKREKCRLAMETLHLKEDCQDYALLVENPSAKYIDVMCGDGIIRSCKIPFSVWEKEWLRKNDLIVVKMDKYDCENVKFIKKYSQFHALRLKELKELPKCLAKKIYEGNGASDFMIYLPDGTDVTHLNPAARYKKEKKEVEDKDQDFRGNRYFKEEETDYEKLHKDDEKDDEEEDDDEKDDEEEDDEEEDDEEEEDEEEDDEEEDDEEEDDEEEDDEEEDDEEEDDEEEDDKEEDYNEEEDYELDEEDDEKDDDELNDDDERYHSEYEDFEQ